MAWPFSAGQPIDSGIVATVPTSLTTVTGTSTIGWLMGMQLANTTNDDITVEVTDSSSVVAIPNIHVPANGVVVLNWNFMPIGASPKWVASAAGVNGRMW